jgi:4-hydroxy-tetrahydrodipicolinate synthase
MDAGLIDRRERGVFPISVTPFHDDGRVDLDSMDRLVDFFVACGVPGVTVLGVLGEANKLAHDESIALVQRVLRRSGGRLKVIVGTSHVGFEPLQAFVAAAMDAGASGIMVAPAAGLKTEDQVLGWFEALFARLGEVPVALQDFPQTTGVFMSAATVGELVRRHAGIRIVKHEESPALRKITRLRAQEAAGARERVCILVGNSAMHLPQELARGVDGANTGVAFPEMLIEVCNRFFAGQPESGEDLYDLFLPLVRHEQPPGIGLAIRKEIFRRRGLIASARLRAPGAAMDRDDHAELTRLLARLQRRLAQAGEGSLIRLHPVGPG